MEQFFLEHDGEWPESFRNMMSCYIAGQLLSRVAFAAAAEAEAGCGSAEKNMLQHELYFRRHPLNRLLVSFYRERRFLVRESVCNREHLKFFARPLLYLTAALLSKILSLRTKSNISSIRPSVWVEYAHNDVCDFMFWRNVVKAEDFDMAYYLDRADTPLMGGITDTIEAMGLKWVDAHFIPMCKYFDFSAAVIGDLLRTLFPMDRRHPAWYRLFEFERVFWFSFFRSVYERFMVRVLIQHQDTSWRQEVQARAVESAGGVMVGFHWSNYPSVVTPTLVFPFHVFFVWGVLISDFVREGGNTCSYILPSGYSMQGEDHKIEQTVALSEHLDFVLAVFDSSAAYNIHQTPETLSQFYVKLLDLLEGNTKWGAIIKSKNWDVDGFYSLPSGGEIVSRLKLLIDDKRAVVLDTAISPAAAAARADLSVCYALNSAGIIAGIHGSRAIHWDCAGWVRHPFYKDPDQRFVFRSLDELEQAITMAAKGDSAIGDFSGWQQKLNYFNDFKAPQRVGRFIQTLMDEIIKTGDNRQSLAIAVRKYIRDNNLGDDFFAPGHLWEQTDIQYPITNNG